MLPFELLIGLRYTRSGRYARSGKGSAGRARNRFISFISGLATVGIALGVAALIVVLSVMNGFQKEVRDRMLGVLSHVEVILPGQPLADLEPLVPEVTRHPEVVASAPFVMGQAMMARDGQMKGILVRGIDPAREPLVSGSLSHLVSGRLESLQAREYRIVLGRELARHLGVAVGETVVLIAADGVVTPAGVSPRLRQFQVSGIFASGHFEYDSNLALIHSADAEVFFRDQALTGLRLMLQDMQRAPDVARQLSSTLPRQVVVRDWSHENRNWFAAVQVEKRMMFIILMLIIAVAAFNLVSMLVMTVSDKRGDIAILRTLGAQRPSIMAIFVVQGAWLGFLGVALGVGLGTLIAANIDSVMAALEGLLGLQVLPKDVARQLSSTLPRQVVVRDWSHENRNWFAAVQVEKRMMFIILMLIIAVAAFNLVSMLVMTVSDKRGDIAILRTLGAQRPSIMAIFVVQGAWLGFLGVALGVGLGTLIAANIDSVMAALEGLLGLQVLPKGIYFIDQLPSDLRLPDVIQIGLTALALSLLATVYPSWRASRIEPAEALRHE